MIEISSIRQRFPWWCDAVAPVAFHVVYPVINWSTDSKYRFAKTVVRAGSQGAVKRVRNWISKGEEGPFLISPVLLRVLCKVVQTTLFKLIWLIRVALSCVIIAGHSKVMGLAKLSSNFTDLTCSVSFALVKRLLYFQFFFFFTKLFWTFGFLKTEKILIYLLSFRNSIYYPYFSQEKILSGKRQSSKKSAKKNKKKKERKKKIDLREKWWEEALLKSRVQPGITFQCSLNFIRIIIVRK